MIPANWTAEQVLVLLLATKITPLMKGAERMRRPRRNPSATFKANVALAAVKGDHTLAASRPADLSVSAAGLANRPPESGPGDGH